MESGWAPRNCRATIEHPPVVKERNDKQWYKQAVWVVVVLIILIIFGFGIEWRGGRCTT
jgi:uncharacterized integral membrane protein